jgi:SPP1 gp7 family putative phage head morphogenesis protein
MSEIETALEIFDTVLQETDALPSERELLRRIIESQSTRIAPEYKAEIRGHRWSWWRYDAYVLDASESNDPRVEMAELLRHRVMMLAFASRRKLDFLRFVRTHPYWMWSAVNDSRTNQDCVSNDGAIKRWDDSFWTDNPIPCHRLFCRCTFIALTEKEVTRRLNLAGPASPRRHMPQP